jgi:hypothetical protein
MSGHTPGPWRVEPHDNYMPHDWGVTPVQVIGADGAVVACNTAFYPTGISESDAHFMAAASGLLAPAKQVMAMLEEHGPSIVPHLLDSDENAGQRLRDAIAAVEAAP